MKPRRLLMEKDNKQSRSPLCFPLSSPQYHQSNKGTNVGTLYVEIYFDLNNL